jgi:hypothetical protein
VEYTLLILAVSVWGNSTENGTPSALGLTEILVYFTKAGSPCERCSGNHCKLPDNKPNLTVTCHKQQVGALRYYQNLYNGYVHPDMAAVIECPFPPSWRASEMPDQWNLTLSVGDDTMLHIPVCYHHVTQSREVVLCTEPIYGYEPSASFWRGEPHYASADLFQAFLVYHVQLMGMQVRVNDLHRSFETPLRSLMAQQNWTQDTVSYRSGWQLENALVDRNGVWDYEVLAEATCHWEHRFRSKWFMIVHSPDNFVIPREPNTSLASLLAGPAFVNASSIIVPIMQACSLHTPRRGANILAQYGRVGGFLAHGDLRHTPIGNPRHIHYSWIHWNGGRRIQDFREIDYAEAGKHVQTMHAMALTRTEYDLRDQCAIHPALAPLAASLEAAFQIQS